MQGKFELLGRKKISFQIWEDNEGKIYIKSFVKTQQID